MASAEMKTREAASQGSWSVPGMVAEWIRQGTEGFIATQKILLDLAAQQNALALTIARERLGLISPVPSKTMVDLGSKSIHNFMESQRILLEIAAKENDIIHDGLKPTVESTVVEGLAEIVHQGLANAISAQKNFLTFVESEAEDAIREMGEGKRFETARLSDVAREGVKRFVKTQKKFLDLVERELMQERPEPEEDETKTRSLDVFEMARESVDAYVRAQEHLLDLASDQVDVNVKFVRELFSVDIRKEPRTTIQDVLKKSADSFVAAQKALAELAARPHKAGREAGRAAGHPAGATA